MDAAATSSRPKRDWPRIPPNYVSLRDLQELRLKEKMEQQERPRQREEETAAVGRRRVEEAVLAPGPKMEGRASWGASERNHRGKQWAAVAHRQPAPPPPAGGEGAAKKMDGVIGVVAVAHGDSPTPPTRAEDAVDKTDGAIGVLAAARREARPPTRAEGAAKKTDDVVGGRTVKKGTDEAAASALQGGAKPANKETGEVSAGTEQPSLPAEPATGGRPEEKSKGKGKASGEHGAASLISSTAGPVEAASASSRGRANPANRRYQRKGCVNRSAAAVVAAPAETANASPPRVVEPHNKGKKKPSGSTGRRTGAAPASGSSDEPSPAAEFSSNRKSGGALGTITEAKPGCLGEKPPVVEVKTKAKDTAPLVRVVVGYARPASPTPAAKFSSSLRSGGALGTTEETKPESLGKKMAVVGLTRPPSIGGPRHHAGVQLQHGGVWVPKVVAPSHAMGTTRTARRTG